MDRAAIGFLMMAGLFVSLATGFPIAGTFLLLSVVGLSLILNFDQATGMLAQGLYYTVASPNWAALPLFILMGTFAAFGGYAQVAFHGLNRLTRGLTGALGVATCYSCALFGAISGSAAATGAIFTRLTLPEMRRHGYDKQFAAGIVVSAGTFATMIPPSGLMIVYCLFTQQSVGKLFAAGVLPGLLTATVYAFLIVLRVRRNPNLVRPTTAETEVASKERVKALWTLAPIMFIAFVVLGGIYGGFFTPTEAAAVGCAVTLALGLFQNTLRNQRLVRQALRESAVTASMIFIIIISALIFSRFLAITQLPTQLAVWVTGLEVPRFVILMGILAIWFFLGMLMVPDGIYAVTLPIFFPLILKLGYDPIWFGIVTIKLSEIANVTPPVGLNIFAIQGVAGDDVEITDVYKGVWPFVACDVLVLALLIAVPDIVLLLPKLIFG